MAAPKKWFAGGTAIDPMRSEVDFVGAVATEVDGKTTLTFQTGDITSVVAGNGLTGGGASGAVTLTVAAANGSITVGADAIEVGYGAAGAMAAEGVAAANSAGVAATAARIDHVHAVTADGTLVDNTANVNVVGGIPLVFRTLIASGADGDVDIVSTHKIRVIDAWAVLKGAGTAGCVLTLKNGTNAVSDAVDVSAGGDRDKFHVGEIDDAQHEIAAAGTIRWTKASTGGDFPGAEAYVMAIRVA